MEKEVSCVHCESKNVKFKYLNNGKSDQHRYLCLDCEVVFTWENHDRPKPKHYKKVRNQDPVEIQGQRTQCNKCFAVNNAQFKFYNNKRQYGETQPRFKCLSCGDFFQMHLEGGVLVAIETSRKRSRNLNANEVANMPGTLVKAAEGEGADGYYMGANADFIEAGGIVENTEIDAVGNNTEDVDDGDIDYLVSVVESIVAAGGCTCEDCVAAYIKAASGVDNWATVDEACTTGPSANQIPVEHTNYGLLDLITMPEGDDLILVPNEWDELNSLDLTMPEGDDLLVLNEWDELNSLDLTMPEGDDLLVPNECPDELNSLLEPVNDSVDQDCDPETLNIDSYVEELENILGDDSDDVDDGCTDMPNPWALWDSEVVLQ